MGAILKGIGLDIWREVSEAFGRRHGPHARDLWLSGARPRSFLRGLFTLEVPDPTAKAAIDGTYLADLESIFHDITGSPVRLRVHVLEPDLGDAEDDGAASEDAASVLRASDRGSHDARATSRGDGRATRGAPAGPARTGAAVRPGGLAALRLDGPVQFVATAASRMALGVLDQWLRGDSGLLFVHGPEGAGKTALAGFALLRLAEVSVASDPLVLSGESLALDVQRASRDGTFGALQRDWSGRDIVILDEAHRLRGRETAQRVAVSLIGPALDRGGRVLVLSRHAPRQIQALSDRLLSHFVGGQTVSLAAPEPADRELVLGAHAQRMPVTVDDGVVAALAMRGPAGLGDALSVLGQVAAQAAHEGRALQIADIERWLRGPQPAEVSLDALIAMASDETGIAAERIRSSEKSRHVALVRHLCVYLAARSLGLSARQICRSFRQRSPSIVAYSRRAVERKRANDPAYERLIQTIQTRLGGAQRDFTW